MSLALNNPGNKIYLEWLKEFDLRRMHLDSIEIYFACYVQEIEFSHSRTLTT